MRKKTPRAICLEILRRVEEADRHPDALLSDSFKQYRHLTPLDRAFLTELTYGILRWQGKLDWVISRFLRGPLEKTEPAVLNVLRLGLYQILFLTRTPVSAAVNESVELAKKIRGKGGAGFVNAILRSVVREREKIVYPDITKDPILHLSVMESYPLWLVQRWVSEWGLEETHRICRAMNQISPLTLRTNTLKISLEDLIQKLREKGLTPLPACFSDDGIVVKDAPPVSEIPFFKEGLYIIQDEASQLVTEVLGPQPGERILDACAAPGGKTTHIAQRMESEGEIYALDISREKLGLVEEACKRLGIKIVKIVKTDGTKTLPLPEKMKFDRVLVDVPCSGFGTLRKNPDLKWRRGEEDIKRISELQASILANVSRYVKDGGMLVYSTCTVFREENEDVVESFLDEHTEFRLDRIGDVLPEKCHRFIKDGYFKTFPPGGEMDGFFAARIRKGQTFLC